MHPDIIDIALSHKKRLSTANSNSASGARRRSLGTYTRLKASEVFSTFGTAEIRASQRRYHFLIVLRSNLAPRFLNRWLRFFDARLQLAELLILLALLLGTAAVPLSNVFTPGKLVRPGDFVSNILVPMIFVSVASRKLAARYFAGKLARNPLLKIGPPADRRIAAPGTDLGRTNFSGLYLAKAILVNANLSAANLRATDLSGSDLTGATLCRANMIAANLTNAILVDADLTGAYLTDALLAGVHWSSRTRWPNQAAAAAMVRRSEETAPGFYVVVTADLQVDVDDLVSV
ncbi:MAG: pentapeptide repeat-containing protein [Mycobacterium sp.]